MEKEEGGETKGMVGKQGGREGRVRGKLRGVEEWIELRRDSLRPKTADKTSVCSD